MGVALLFAGLHALLLLLLICAFVPTMAAESIARERREGTLRHHYYGAVDGGLESWPENFAAQSLRHIHAVAGFTLPIITVPLFTGRS